MRRRVLVLGLLGLLGVSGVVSGGSAATQTGAIGSVAARQSAAGSWGVAVKVPGTATLNRGGNAALNSVSCAAAGNCAAGGRYKDGSGHFQAFVVSETNGSWGQASKVPGTATLNSGGNAVVNSVSCGAVGDCAAGGRYKDGSGHFQAFVVSQTNGVWGHAINVPGMATLNKGIAEVNSVSCGAPGDCAAGGRYSTTPGGVQHYQAFVVSETNGTWGNAVKVPGTATLNHGNANVNSISCATAGNCAAGGYYKEAPGVYRPFVVGETNGSWGVAVEVPGMATLNHGGFAEVNSVSCGAAGDCAAGGMYTGVALSRQAFVVSETNGVWSSAIRVPGMAKLNTAGWDGVYSVSCGVAGNCAAGGAYRDHSGYDHDQAFVVRETNGVWGQAINVPGLATLNKGSASLYSVSCDAAGDCAAGGKYENGSGHQQAFVVREANGNWGIAVKVPGTATLNSGGDAAVYSVSCAAARKCAAGGYYRDGSQHTQAFVVSFK